MYKHNHVYALFYISFCDNENKLHVKAFLQIKTLYIIVLYFLEKEEYFFHFLLPKSFVQEGSCWVIDINIMYFLFHSL